MSDVKSRDGAKHDVALYLDADAAIATNSRDESVVWSRAEVRGLHLLRTSTTRQPMLEKSGDNLRIDWEYFYLGVPAAEGSSTLAAGNQTYRDEFTSTGQISKEDDLAQPRIPQSRHPPAPTLNFVLNLGSVGAEAITGHVLLSYDDVYSVEYMQQGLLPYWRTEYSTFSALVERAENDYLPLKELDTSLTFLPTLPFLL